MSAHTFGTKVTGGLDIQKLGKALKQPGIDPRCWCSEGTVGTLDSETGELDFTNRHAIYNDSAGTHVDVELQPLGWHVPVRYAPAQAGEATISGPVRPGDIVLVEFPGGDTSGGVITKILNSRSQRQPVENGRPIFDNNRLLIHTRTVPIDMRTAGGSRLLLEQDATATVTGKKIIAAADDVRLAGATASHPVPQGDNLQTAVNALADAVAAYASAVTGIIGALAPAEAILTPLIAAFKALPYLSAKVKTA
jgi:hypothetical protein